jgi:hypothetical protein
VEAYGLNDPYFPRPLRQSELEQRVWKAFVESYIAASDNILEEQGVGDEVLGLPEKFILELIPREKDRMATRG